MGFDNPIVPWREIERALSDRPRWPTEPRPVGANGGDSPAWSPVRAAYVAPALVRRPSTTRYAELHCHSHFSFLDGASSPEELTEEAVRLDLQALALTDHDGLYGVVRFAEAAKAVGMPTVFGAELSLGLTKPQNGVADPEGTHLLVLARHPAGYAALASTISAAQLAGKEKGKPIYDGIDLAAAHRDGWLVLTGCRKGAVPRALVEHGPAAAARELQRLVATFGRHNVVVELCVHGDPLDSARNDALAALAVTTGVECVATTNAHYATPSRRRLATAMAAVRARRSLDDLDGWLPGGAGAHLRSGDEQHRRFARWPGVVERAAELARACAFDLQLVAPRLPPFPCPPGFADEMAYLRHLVEEGARGRYGPRGAPGTEPAYATLDRELAIIEQLGYPGYFLVVWEIVRFCNDEGILCQGRGSAANSAVCYALGITAVDAVHHRLLFERFLSAERDGPPDIDIDIESGRREEVIQHVYERYGREHTAQVANVITYRAKSAIRDVAKALGYDLGQQDAWSKQVDAWGAVAATAREQAGPGGGDIPGAVLALAQELEHAPRHLGIHSGGMVICDRPIVEVCPVEWARMEDRSVLQWDKDDCAAIDLVKFDLLGLGMLEVLHRTFDLVAATHGLALDLYHLPEDEAEVYDMLCRADSVGVFQVESRAQMATLPRLRPRAFFDLVVEIALIRPGPIQGGSVHPYIRRKNGREDPTYLHPLLGKSLSKTLGVPLFQEQLMQIAIDVGGFTPGEADALRQAMGAKRSHERMERLHRRFVEGAMANEDPVPEEVAEQIWDKLAAFASYGFPESHAVSFAYLAYASSWLKRWFPAAFCAGLLASQPMGFYAPHTLVQDARRHGVEVRIPDLNRSGATATLEDAGDPAGSCGQTGPDRARSAASREVGMGVGAGRARVGVDRTSGAPQRPVAEVRERIEALVHGRVPGLWVPAAPDADAPPETWGRGGPAVRLGLAAVRGIGDDLAEALVAERDAAGPYRDVEDLARRSALTLPQLEALAVAGAYDCFGLPRREALWAAGAASQVTVGRDGALRLPGIVTGLGAPPLPPMTPAESGNADLWATGVSPEGHPTRFLRERLAERGVVTATGLAEVEVGERVLVAGVVTHRQRPATAGGTMFLNLEDETGLINVVLSVGCWRHHRRVAREAPAMLVRGRLERAEGVTNVIADRLEWLPLRSRTKSRDFR